MPAAAKHPVVAHHKLPVHPAKPKPPPCPLYGLRCLAGEKKVTTQVHGCPMPHCEVESVKSWDIKGNLGAGAYKQPFTAHATKI
eukprot:gene7035-14966_t